jgi:hypothetical protein
MGRWLSRIEAPAAAASPARGHVTAQTSRAQPAVVSSVLSVRLPGYARDFLVSDGRPFRVLSVMTVPEVKCSKKSDAPQAEGEGSSAAAGVWRPHRLPAAHLEAAHLHPWTGSEIDRFRRRTAHFVGLGLREQDAEDLAETLHLRDITADHRHLCIECRHLSRWKCRAHVIAKLDTAILGKTFATTAQDCPGFCPEQQFDVDQPCRDKHGTLSS